MNKKLAHIILCFGDIFSLWCIWIGYHEFQRILMEVANQAGIIGFSNTLGFFILASFLPPIHFLTIVEYYRPHLIHGHKRLMNQGAIAMVILLITAGFISSSWIKNRVENAGYHYCRQASDIGFRFRHLVYTRDVAICEDLTTAKNDRRK